MKVAKYIIANSSLSLVESNFIDLFSIFTKKIFRFCFDTVSLTVLVEVSYYLEYVRVEKRTTSYVFGLCSYHILSLESHTALPHLHCTVLLFEYLYS